MASRYVLVREPLALEPPELICWELRTGTVSAEYQTDVPALFWPDNQLRFLAYVDERGPQIRLEPKHNQSQICGCRGRSGPQLQRTGPGNRLCAVSRT